MHKSLIGLAAAPAVGLATLAGPSTANAGCYGCAVGAGIIGGVAAGAIIGSAIANNPPPPPGYYPPPPRCAIIRRPGRPTGPGYAQLAPGCYWAKRQVWVEGYGYRWRTVRSASNRSVPRPAFDRATNALNSAGRLERAGRFALCRHHLMFVPCVRNCQQLRQSAAAMRSCR